MILILLIIGIFVLLIITAILILYIVYTKRRNKYKILKTNSGYVPMIGNFYIYKTKDTGELKLGIGDQYILCETEEEAKKIIDDYKTH